MRAMAGIAFVWLIVGGAAQMACTRATNGATPRPPLGFYGTLTIGADAPAWLEARDGDLLPEAMLSQVPREVVRVSDSLARAGRTSGWAVECIRWFRLPERFLVVYDVACTPDLLGEANMGVALLGAKGVVEHPIQGAMPPGWWRGLEPPVRMTRRHTE